MMLRSNLLKVMTLLRNLNYESMHDSITRDIKTEYIHILFDSTLHQLMKTTVIANELVYESQQYIQNRYNEIHELFIRFESSQFFIIINSNNLRHPLILSLQEDVFNI